MTSLVLKRGILFANCLLFAALLNYLPFENDVSTGLSILTFIAILWLTEAVHISVTALLIPVLAVVLGVFETKPALGYFANPIIFLFLGGFALASALNRQELDKAIAAWVLKIAKGRMFTATLLLFVVAAGLSMWISNTATAAMMLPLAIGMLSQIDRKKYASTWVFVLLGIAYSAGIGGIATLVGSPPNAIAAAETGMTFLEWMRKALPFTLILLPAAIAALYFSLKPNLNVRVELQDIDIEWTRPRIITLTIFILTVSAWIFSAPLNQWLGDIKEIDTIIAMAAMLALAISGVVGWKDIDRTTDWGVLILFGGGVCLSAVLKETNTSLFLAESIGSVLAQVGPIMATLIIAIFVVILTSFASNTASAALLIPVFVGISGALGVDPVTISVLIAIAASCAFMLPVSTPPNAIVFGTGYIPQSTMLYAGFWVSAVSVLLLTIYSHLFW